MNHATVSDRIFDFALSLAMIVFIGITIYPLLYVAFASLSDANQLMSHTGILYKSLGFNLDAYARVFSNPRILTGYLNTIFLVVVGVSVSLLLTTLGAYVLSRKNVLWNRAFIFIILFTMFFSGGLIPLYLIVKGVGLYNSLFAIILPFAINIFNLIIMRTAFMAIPDSLEEAAKMEGANHGVILFRIIIPLSMPVIAVMILYYAVEKWNGWFYASIFLQNRDLYPLQLILREILLANSTEGMNGGAGNDGIQIAETIKYATIMVATVPVLMIYPAIQKYFVKGAMIGALKG